MPENKDKIKDLFEDFKSSQYNKYKTEEDFRAAFSDPKNKESLYMDLAKEYEWARSDFFSFFDTEHETLKKKGQSGQKPQTGSGPKPQSKSTFTSTGTIIDGTQPWAGGINKEKGFETRAKNPNQPALPDEENPGKTKTHKMASAEVDGKYIAYPTIIQKGPGLQELSDDEAFEYAMKTGEYKEFKTDEEAKAYAKGGYKKGTPLEPKVKTLEEFNEKYKTVYTEPEFQGKEPNPDQKAQLILSAVADNVAMANAVPKLKEVIKNKADRQLDYVEAAKITEEEQQQKAKEEYENWVKSDKASATINKVKSELVSKYEQKNKELAAAYQQGQLSKQDAEAALKGLNESLNKELNDAVSGLWEQEFESVVKPKLQTYFNSEAERRYQQAVLKDRVLSNRAIYTINSIANSDRFKQMNFDDKKRIIAATWDSTRAMLEKKGYNKDFIEKYREQYFSEFVMAASRTPKGDVTSYGVRDWAQDALKEIEAEKAELEKNKGPETPGLSMNIGGFGAVPVVTNEKYNEDLGTLKQAEDQIRATLARPELGGGTLSEGIGYGFKYGKNLPIPYVKTALELSNNLKLYDINKKVKNGVPLTDGEKLLLHSLGMDQAYQQDAKPTFGFTAGEITTISVPYMVDMAAGNFAAAPARTAVKELILKAGKKYAEKAAFKYGVAQPISVIVGEMARTAADPVKWGKSFVEHMNPEVKFAFGMDVDADKQKTAGNDVVGIDEMVAILDRSQYDLLGQKTGKGMDPVEAFAYAFLDNLKENLSERIGGALGGEVSEQLVKTLARNNEWAKRMIIATMLRKNGGLNPNSFQKTLKELKDATGLNGIIGENIEEYAAAAAEDFMYNRQFGTSFTPEFFKETAAVTGLIQVPMQLVGLSAKYMGENRTYKVNYRKGDGEIAEIEIPLDIASKVFSPKGKVEASNWLNTELGKTNLTPEQRLAVLQNMNSKMYWDEVRAKSKSMFGASYDALNDENQTAVRDAAYKAIAPFVKTRDQMLLDKLKRDESNKDSVPAEPTQETETPVSEGGEPPVTPPSTPPSPSDGAGAMPLTADEEGSEGVEGDPEQELNDIADKIIMGLPLEPNELEIVKSNSVWFEDKLKDMEVEIPEPEAQKQELTGLGQENDEAYQKAMSGFRDKFLEERGLTLDEFNALPPDEKKMVEDAYEIYLQEVQEAEEEAWDEERKAKQGKPKKKPRFEAQNETDFLAQELEGSRFKMESIKSLSDRNLFETGKKRGNPYALNWFTSRPGAQSLDEFVSFMIDDEQSVFYGKDEKDVIKKITDFIIENPGGATSYINERIKQIELQNNIDRQSLENPDLLNQIDEFVSEFSDEEVEEMLLWMEQEGNLEEVEKMVDEWLKGEYLSQFGGFVHYFTDKFNPSKEGTSIKEPALAKKIKQLIDENRKKQQGVDSKGETGDKVEKDGDGKGEEEKQEVNEAINSKIFVFGLFDGFAVSNRTKERTNKDSAQYKEVFDPRTTDGQNNTKSFIKIIERNGKKYRVVGLRMSNPQTIINGQPDRSGMSYAGIIDDGNLPNNIDDLLIKKAIQEGKDLYENTVKLKDSDFIMPSEYKSKTTPESKEYRYELRNRPFTIGSYPKEDTFLRFEQTDGSRFGYVVYSEKLPAEKWQSFELAPETEILEATKGKVFESEYYNRIIATPREGNTNFVSVEMSEPKDGSEHTETITLSAKEFFKNIEDKFFVEKTAPSAKKSTPKPKKKSGPSIDNLNLDDFNMDDLDMLGEADLFGSGPESGKSDIRKDYEKTLAAAKKELKEASKDLDDTKSRARKEGVEGNTLDQILRPKRARYEMALKQLDIIRNQEKNVRIGEESQQKLFEGSVSDFLKKELTPEQMAAGKRFINQFFEKGIYDFPRIAEVVRAKAGDTVLYDKLPALVKVYSAEMISVDDDIADKMSNRAQVRSYVENFITELNTEQDDTADNEEGGTDDPTKDQGGSGPSGNQQGNQPNNNSGSGTPGSGSGGTGASSGAGGGSGTPSGKSGGQGNNSGGGNSGTGNGNTPTGQSGNDGRGAGKGKESDGNTPSPKLTFDEKKALQLAAEPVPVIVSDKENINFTVPFALDSQKEDVFRAENALFTQGKKGILFTNGTGTGKTSTALAIVKRFIKEGRQDGFQVYVNNKPVRRFQSEKEANDFADTLKSEDKKVEVREDFGKERRVLVLTPKQSINNKFVNEASWFNMDAYNLQDTKDVGDGYNLVVTTHANFRDNENVQNQDWDMIVVDESDQIMSSQEGKSTNAVNALRIAAKHYSTTRKIAESRIGSPELQRLNEEIQSLEQEMETGRNEDIVSFLRTVAQKRARLNELVELRNAERKAYEKLIEAESERMQGMTKVVFMSATPFASSPALDYAEGFLFDYPKDKNGQRSQTQFMAQNFAWRVNDYGKVKDKSGGRGVDQGFLEREFHEKLKAEGVLFTRMLDSEYDYSRTFILFLDPEGEQGIGRMIDKGIQVLESDEFKLRDLVLKKFNFLYTMRLLEAYKAKMSIPLIEKLLSQNKKIVIFHNYNEGAPSHPFHFTAEEIAKAAGSHEGAMARIQQIQTKIKEFNQKYPEFYNLDMTGLVNPIATITSNFPSQSLVFNGSVSKSKRLSIINEFNESANKNIIIVQKEAGKAGIDLHDQLGNAQRVEINLGIPIMSNDAIQPEGRIFRVGNRSNAVFLYPAIHTNFERFIWSDKSAPRSGTTENFALGNDARGMEETLRTGYLEAIPVEEFYSKLDSGDYGVGGKTYDKQLNQLSAYQKAIQHYHLRQKRSRNREPEGVDYYPTPEPLGFKIVEWADIKPGQEVLEPSAGSGSIARYVPELTGLDIIEPSADLRSQAAMLSHKNSNHFGDRFEDLALVNKYDRIVMNPPFGHAGKTAMDHLAKAFQHLRDGGRVVALVPQGKMDERLNNFLYGENAPENAVLRAVIKLPPVTFEKAGTNVNTQIVIIDKISDEDLRNKVAAMGGSTLGAPNTMLKDLVTIKELFDEIEDMGVPPTIDMEPKQGSSPSQGQNKNQFELIKNYHAKEKRDNWVVKMNVRIDDFAPANAKAKELGGNYSSYKAQGAIPGFQFKTEASAKEFLEWISGGPKLQKETVDFPLTESEVEFRDNLTKALTDSFEGVVDEVVVEPSFRWMIAGDYLAQVEVYHGSPFKFNKFELSKIGTGEGAQAFGWGLYFTDLESIAKDYARKIQIQGVLNKNIPVFADVAIKEEMSLDKDVLIKNLTSKINDGIHNSVTVQKAIDFLVASTQSDLNKLLVGNKNRNLYKVSLHKGKTPSEYTWLEWDKEVSLTDVIKINKAIEEKGFDGRVSTAIKGKELYSELVKIFGDEYKVEWGKQASLFLLENGIDGIKYPAESIARGATSGNARGFNYVVFNENAISIEDIISFEKVSTGEVLGAFYKDRVYIDPRLARPETPIHEFGHAFTKLLSEHRPDVLRRGLELVVGSKYLEEVENNPAYAKLTYKQKQEEALVRAIADKGVVMAANEKKGFTEWLKEFWQAIKDIVGLDKVTAKQLSEMDLDAFTQAAVKTMFDKAAIQDIAKDKTAKTIVVDWYSRLNSAIEQKGNTMTGAQWKDWIEARANEGLLDREEVYWTGFEDYIEENKYNKITKDAALKFLKENKVEIAEKILSTEKKSSLDGATIAEARLFLSENNLSRGEDSSYYVFGSGWDATEEDVVYIEDVRDAVTKYNQNPNEDSLKVLEQELITSNLIQNPDAFATAMDMLDYANKFLNSVDTIKEAVQDEIRESYFEEYENQINSTRLQYTSPDLSNKKEIVIYASGREFSSNAKYSKEVELYNLNDDIHFGTVTTGRALVWLRFGDSVTEDGRKVMVIDEIQSQRHEAGRDYGYKGQFFVTKMNGDKIKGAPIFYSSEEAEDWAINNPEFTDQSYRIKEGKTPIAPFKKTYTDLAAKRALKYAVENGYDAVAWNTGEQVSQRFRISNVVDTIQYNYFKTYDNYFITGTYNNKEVFFETNVSFDRVKDLLGSEIANKIKNGEGREYSTGLKEIKVDEHTIGSEPMKKYYGSVKEGEIGDVGKAFEKVARKYDKNVRVSPIDVDMDYAKGYTSGMSIPITDNLYNALSDRGLPLMQVENINHTSISNLVKTKDYEKAKSGDIISAYEIVNKIVKSERLSSISNYPNAKLIPVISNERTGRNMLPLAYAQKIHEIYGNEIETDIVQSNRSYHTGASPAARLLRPVYFDGKINPGQEYILIDDVSTSGATLKALEIFVEENGGKVVLSTNLAQGRFGPNQIISKDLLNKLNDKFGKEKLNTFVQDYGIARNTEELTKGQAARIYKFKSLNSIRDKFFEAERQRIFNEVESPQYEVSKTKLEAAIDDLKSEWDKNKSLGIRPNQNDPTGLVMAGKFIKVVALYVKQGITNFKDLAVRLGQGSEEWIRYAYERVKTKYKAVTTDSLALAVFGQGASKGFVDAVSAAKLMPAKTLREFLQNMDALAAATDNEEQKQIFASLKSMAYQDLKTAQQFISEVGNAKPNVQIAVNRNGVPQYIYNDRGMGPLTADYFSLSGRVKKALNDIGVPVREKKVPRALGAYFIRQKYIGTRSLMEIFTAIHEGMHFIDQTNGMAKNIIDSGDKDLINELKQIYQEFYPNAKPTHPTSLQVIEGLAVFMNEYLADPIKISQDYSEIFNKVFVSGSTYNHPLVNKLYDAMANIMDGVKQLSPIFSTGLRMADAQQEVKKGFGAESSWKNVNVSDVGFKMYMALQFDTGSAFRTLDELADTALSDESLEIAYFTNMQSGPIAQAWLNGKQMMAIIQKNGTYKYEKLSVNSILDELGRIAKKNDRDIEFVRDVFNQYLINRRAKGDYNRMVDAKNDYDMYMANFPDPDAMTPVQAQIAKRLLDKFVEYRTIVNNDNFDIRQVNAGIAAFEKEFKDATAIFDKINEHLLEVARNTGLISEESYKEWSKNKDYASFQRYIHDDLMTGGGNSQGGNLTQFKKRTGSSGKSFIGPLEAMILHIPKTIMKGYNNMFWMKFAQFVNEHGEDMGISKRQLNQDFIRVPKTAVMIGGVPTFGHLENRGYVSFYINGSKQYYEAADWIKALATTLSPEDMNGAWEKILFAGANVFGLMTTAANPTFALRNFTIDQISAFINSTTGKRDFIGAGDAIQVFTQWRTVLNELGMKIDTPQGEELLKKYLALAGDRFNASKAFNFDRTETVGEIINRVSPKKTIGTKAKQVFDTAIDVLAAPVNATEIMTRFAEFKRAIDLGYDDSTALFMAANVSAPFYRRGLMFGRAGRVAYRSHVYWNASLQALLKNIESIKKNPKRGGGLAATLAFISAYSIMQVFNGGGDDDDIAAMANKPSEEFAKYVFIWGGPELKWIRVRVPESITAITGISQMAAFSYAYEKNKKAPFKYTPSQYFSPIREGLPGGVKQAEGILEGILTGDSDMAGANALQMIPTAVSPTINTLLSVKSYPTLMPIVTGEYANMESQYQQNKNTSEFAKWMGEKFGVSPMKTDYFLKAQFGANARFALELNSDSERKLLENPYRFATKNTWQRGREYALFWKQLEAVTKHKNSFNPMLESKGVNMLEIEKMFNDDHITPADYVKPENMKKFKKEFPVEAKQFEDSYKQFRFGENLKELSYIVDDLSEKESITPEQKLQWFELLYAFNRNLPMQYVQAKDFLDKLMTNKALIPAQKDKIKSIYGKLPKKM
jgi:hypothetical protein